MENKKYDVYSMVHPEDMKVRYVGITSNLKQRYQQHLRNALWIQPLKEKGLAPILDILDSDLPLEVARKQEKYWIEKYTKEGHPLENLIHNMEAISEREERKDLEERLHRKFAHFPEEQRHELIQLTIRGYAHSGYEHWGLCLAVVQETIEELESTGLLTAHLNELDIAKLTAKIIGVGTQWRRI